MPAIIGGHVCPLECLGFPGLSVILSEMKGLSRKLWLWKSGRGIPGHPLNGAERNQPIPTLFCMLSRIQVWLSFRKS